jgi:hypothetical protein
MPTSASLGAVLLGTAAYYAETRERRIALTAAAIPLALMVPYTILFLADTNTKVCL